MLSDFVIRALDVGYGNVKFVTAHKSIEEAVICDMFPSRAPAASESGMGEGTLKVRDTVIVNVNGASYEVGHHVAQAQDANDISATLDDKFVRSDAYMARVLGAFHYMFKDIEQDYIDVLVVGLPVVNMKKQKDFLIKLLKRDHTLPNGRLVTIKDVKVFEQPLGAFFNFMYAPNEPKRPELANALKATNLIIDPGMFTFDWMVVDKLMANERSGGTDRAMSDVLKAIAKVIAKEVDSTPNKVFKMLDDAIRENRNPRFSGEELEIDNYLSYAKTVINQSVDALYNKVGDGVDIDNIMLVGGGARFFLDAIQEKYPKHKIITTSNSVYANVIGFQMFGEKAFLSEQVKARKTSIQAQAAEA